MFGRILDSIPGVGHVKGAWHYATGDSIAGDRAMYEATRSTAVMAGGAVGVLGGPAGMIAGAAAAGALTDTVTSVVTGEAQGIILGVSDIAEDISNGEVPLGSVARTGLIVGSDIIGGLGGATIGNCATKVISESAGKSVGKAIVKQVIKSEISIATRSTLAHGTSRILIEAAEEKSKHQNSESAPSSSKTSPPNQQKNAPKKSEPSKSSSTGGSGGQPPNNNENNNKKEHNEEKAETHWDAFLKIFKKKTLEEIILKGKNIFKSLDKYQKKALKDLIIEIRNSGYLDLESIINITVEVLLQLEEQDVTSQNFLNLAKFVVAYVHEQLAQRNDTYNQVPSNFPDLSDIFNKRRQQLTRIITSELAQSISTLLDLFKDLANKIKDLMKTVNPQFTNLIAAIYHYFKHKFISEKNRTFTPSEYFDLAREMLSRLYKLPRYQKLIKDGKRRIVYERYYASMGRRLAIVLKLQAGIWKLSSCYWSDIIDEDDGDGDEWINDEKLPRG